MADGVGDRLEGSPAPFADVAERTSLGDGAGQCVKR